MNTSFRFVALPYEIFSPLFDRSDAELAASGAARWVVDEKPGFPCRVSLADAEVGETVLSLSYTHHDVASPYRASGPIFVRRSATTASPGVDEIPAMFRYRSLSIRAYDAAALMVGAEVAEGTELEPVIRRFLAREDVSYLHIHNAKPGCFDCRVERVGSSTT